MERVTVSTYEKDQITKKYELFTQVIDKPDGEPKPIGTEGKWLQQKYTKPAGAIYYNKDAKTSFVVYGRIYAKYTSLGAEKKLGYPTTSEGPTHDYLGRYSHFQKGSIYWSKETGAYEVLEPIRNKWQELGGVKSFLGYPITGTEGEAVKCNHFQGGSIYWKCSRLSDKQQVYEVHGDINEKWSEYEQRKTPLGYPTTDERDDTRYNGPKRLGGRYNDFEKGSIYWSKKTGAHVMLAPIRNKWKRKSSWSRVDFDNGQTIAYPLFKDVLGYPITDTDDEKTLIIEGENVQCNHFQGGAIYWPIRKEPHGVRTAVVVLTRIAKRWNALEKGKFGYPISDTEIICDGTPDGTYKNVFKKNDGRECSITWNTKDGYNV